MAEDELISFEPDSNSGGIPSEMKRRRQPGTPPRPPALWSSVPTQAYEGQLGSYPKGFLRWAERAMGVPSNQVVHVCSGALPHGYGRLRIDIRPQLRPDVVADARHLPMRSGSVRAMMIDPPYSKEYARDLYGVEYPRPSHLLNEAARVLEPGGVVGFLHFLVPMVPKERGLRIEAVFGVTTGAGYRIRAFTLFRKEQACLFA